MKGKTNKYIAAALAGSLLLGVLSPYITPASSAYAKGSGERSGNTTQTPATEKTTSSEETVLDLAQADKERYAPEKFHKYGITYKEFVKKNGEPRYAHILIGTYLIDLVPTEQMMKDGDEALTSETAIAAKTSKLTYQQNVTFYKSELGDGTWRDIDLAEGLDSIRPGSGTRVSDSEMDNMLITVYVSGGKSNSTLDEDENGEDPSRKNPFLEPSPYNLDEMPEMENILNMLSDGSLPYTSVAASKSLIAENQSNYFLSERLRYMFDHDEVTDTIKLQDGDVEKAKAASDALRTGSGGETAKKIEEAIDNTEERGSLYFSNLTTLKENNSFTLGENGTVAATERLAYHFSDTRDELTDVMDKAVVNLWKIFLEYKDAAKEAGEEEDSFDRQDDTIYNKDKYSFIYQLCANADATRRGEAYYNLSVNDEFHGYTGSVLTNLKAMNTNGQSYIGRNIQNANYYQPQKEYNAIEKVGNAVSGLITGEKKESNYGGFKSNEQLAEEIQTATEAAQEKYIGYGESTLSRGTTAVSILIYDNDLKMFEKEKKDDAFDALVTETMYATAIRDDAPRSKPAEAALIKDKLTGSQNEILLSYINSGVPAEYASAASDNEKKSVLLVQQQSGKNAENAMEKLVNSYLARETVKDTYSAYLISQLRWIRGTKDSIKDDEYKSYAEEIRSTYETFLLNKMRELGIADPDDPGEGDLTDDPSDKLPKNLDPDDPSYQQTLDALLDKYIKEGNTIPEGYHAEVSIDPATGAASLNFVKDDRDSDSGSSKNDAGSTGGGTEGSAGTNNGQGGKDGVGSGLLVPTGNMLDNLLAFLGKSWDELSPDQQAELVCALNQYGRENKNDEAAELARTLLDKIKELKNPLVYAKYKNNTYTEYVSLGCADRARLYTKFRSVKKKGTTSLATVSMQKTDDGVAYVYQYGKARVKKTGGKWEDITATPVFQRDIYLNRGEDTKFMYISEEDSQNKLKCRAEYIVDKPDAILVTSAMEPNIKKLVDKLRDMYR